MPIVSEGTLAVAPRLLRTPPQRLQLRAAQQHNVSNTSEFEPNSNVLLLSVDSL